MAISGTPFKLISVAHGAVSLGNIKRIRVTEAFETTPLVGGADSGPTARPVTTQDVIAEITSTEPNDYVEAGTKGSLVITFREADNSTTGTVTVANMIRTGQEWSHEHNSEAEHVMSFAVEDGMSSTPITVT